MILASTYLNCLIWLIIPSLAPIKVTNLFSNFDFLSLRFTPVIIAWLNDFFIQRQNSILVINSVPVEIIIIKICNQMP